MVLQDGLIAAAESDNVELRLLWVVSAQARSSEEPSPGDDNGTILSPVVVMDCSFIYGLSERLN